MPHYLCLTRYITHFRLGPKTPLPQNVLNWFVQNNQSAVAQKDQRPSIRPSSKSCPQIDKPSSIRERELAPCSDRTCPRCGKCCDWKWNNRLNDWERSSDATCLGIYIVDKTNHYARGPGGDIFPVCQCDV